MIAVAGGDKVSVLWTRDGSLRRSLGDGRNPSQRFKVGVAFSLDSRSLAFGVWNRLEVRLVDLEEGTEQQLAMPEAGSTLTLAFSPDGRKLVSGGYPSVITIWDWPAKRIDRVLRSHHNQVLCVAFSPDGTRLASTGADQSIKLWDTRTWEETCSLRGHDFEIWSVAFSPDGKRLISSGKDDTIRVWRTEPVLKRVEITFGKYKPWLTSKDETNSTLIAVNSETGEFISHRLFTGQKISEGKL